MSVVPICWPTLMREHGVGRIVTNDSDFHRFEFLEVIDPFAGDLPSLD